jgi:hypothetical protein
MKEYILAIIAGGFLGFLMSLLTYFYTRRKDKKEAFLKTVTEARKDFMEKLRTLTAEFCYLVTTNPKSPELNKVKYQLLLRLFPGEYPKWDGEIVRLLELLTNLNPVPDFDKKLEEFIIRSRYNLQIEWQGLKMEGEKGKLSDIKTEELRQVTLIKCKKYLKKEGII